MSRPERLEARRPRDPSLRPWWFFALTFGWTWTFWWSAVLLGREWREPLTFALFATGGVGPLLSAAVLLRAWSREDDRRDFWRRLLDVRLLRPRWVLLVLGVALLPVGAEWAAAGEGGFRLAGGAAVVLATGFVAGVLEEPGWRGYALDGLNGRHRVVTAAGIVGLAWALWHLPLFFLTGSYQHALGLGSAVFWLFMLNLVALSFVYAAVFVVTARSILAVTVLHALANAAGELSSAREPRTAAIVTVSMAVVAVLVLAHRDRSESVGDSAPPGR